jgi:hypothetical protein
MTEAAHKSAPQIPFRDRLTCTVNEAMQATGLGRTTIDRYRREGRIDTVKLDGRRLIRVPSLVALVEPAP